MKILIADVETTGLSSADEICEIAFVEIDSDLYVINEFQSLIKPTTSFDPAASAASHITASTVEDAPSIEDVLAQFPDDFFANVLLIGHNSSFDRRFLSRYWSIAGEYCTLRAAKSCYPESPNHKLQTLRYYLGLAVDGGSHRAMADVITTYELLSRLVSDSGLTLQDLIETRSRPVRVDKIGFGKYRGTQLEELPLNYRNWLINSAEIDDDLRWSLGVIK